MYISLSVRFRAKVWVMVIVIIRAWPVLGIVSGLQIGLGLT